MDHRNAARVLPDPVGAAISVCRPSRMSGQPSSCGGVAWPKRPRNQASTDGWKACDAPGSGMPTMLPGCNADDGPSVQVVAPEGVLDSRARNLLMYLVSFARPSLSRPRLPEGYR